MSRRSLKKSLSTALEIPPEVALNAACIIITGQDSLVVENHKGIIEYGADKIVFKTIEGRVEVLGEDLTLAALSAESMSVSGALLAICLLREDDYEPR